MKTIKKWQDVPRSEAGWANWPVLMQREIDELRSALAAPQATPATNDEWLANCPQGIRDLANKITKEIRDDRREGLGAHHAYCRAPGGDV